MVEAGCDVIEVGLPYSDPLMDGPTIQEAADQALAAGTRIADVFRDGRAVAATGRRPWSCPTGTPSNATASDAFAADLAAAGGSGVITPDLIPEEAGTVARAPRRRRPRPDLPGRALLHRPAPQA